MAPVAMTCARVVAAATPSGRKAATARPALRSAHIRPAAARRVEVPPSIEEQKQVLTAFCGVSTAAATLLSAGNASAAMEVAQLAGGDNRLGALLALLFPAVGWVLFNIAGPALNQINDMSDKNKKSVAAGLGLGAASMLITENADAAQEVAQLAGGDNRLGALLALLFPAVGWVLFNIGGPALNQINDMSSKNTKSIAAGLGLGAASMLVAENADAAQEVAQLAGGDNRLGALLALLFPAVGWVLFNIAGPALNQINDMSDKNKKSIAAGLGLGAASMLVAENADAAQEVAQLAGGDNRLGALLALLFPAVGWVLFNIGGPALNQINDMSSKNTKSIAAGLGLGAASLLIAENADAAQEVAQLAGGDNRLGALLALLFPAVGWVLFNIAGPALNQINDMSDKNKKSIAAGLGLGAASMLVAENADAAQEVAQLAGGDNRLGALLALLFPAVGWVLFNIGGPALNQINDMSDKNSR
eukprot:jgi/Tetstr1/446657/TSEL_034178.t1